MTLRLFAAIAVPEEIRAELVRLQKGVPGARWRPPENFHITLRFFGEIDERVAEDLDAELANIQMASFPLRLKGAGWFGKADPHALWLGVDTPEPLNWLNDKCERAARRAGLKPEPRKFHPHMTIAYLTGSPVDKVNRFVQRTADLETEAWQVTRFSLYSSWITRGAANIYQVEADYPLT
ncbi:RNA 2',3'-cyclic phosphodiesterase [Maricaulis sp.]|uniref:RNA 2',3'-cyclic phosphodiesterase n=1 Tax=Maricaulis sp. TaxID=1486257 RepID=UPI002609F1A5|nr:RNA 2',3'-cyclic phosphodiesterase [Maricaulis sp.]